ncbi:MAG: glucoamylase family protein [Chitinophagaceae bacterium]
MKGLFLACGLIISGVLNAQEPDYDVEFFSNSLMKGNYFFSVTKDEGNSWVSSIGNKLPVSGEVFHSPGNSLKLEYTDGKAGNWSVTIQRPDIRGQDHYSKPSFLSFWIYVPDGQNPGMYPTLQLVKNDSVYSREVIYGVAEKNKWSKVLIPVNYFGKGFLEGDLSAVTGIKFSQSIRDDEKKILYLDDIELLPANYKRAVTSVPSTLAAKGFARHVDLSWKPVTDPAVKYIKVYRSADGKDFTAIGIQQVATSRYSDYNGEKEKSFWYRITYLNRNFSETVPSGTVKATMHEMNDDELLTMVQEASFRYYWDGAEKVSGLARENIAGRKNMIATGASGFGIMALLVGVERKFISRQQAVERFVKIVGFLEKADKFHGVLGHFYNGPTGKVEPFFGNRDNGGDLVEHSFLVQGLLAARAYFNRSDAAEKMIREKISRLWENTEWDWYRRYPDSKFLYWHWSPDQEWVINHRLIGWNETMVTYLLAIASPTHAVPASLYYSGWANQDSTGVQYREGWSGTSDGSMYTNGNSYYGIKLDVGVSSGGPLFFTHYSYLGYDPHGITDRYTNYFTNNQHIAEISHAYSVANPGKYKGYGDSAWGLTASDGPLGYSADEPVLAQDRGKIAPTGAIGSFPYTPEESMKALKNYYYNYGSFAWGEYGFRDAFNLNQNWASGIYMGLNQAPQVVMIENYRTGLIWKLFMGDKDVLGGLKKLEAVK